MIAGECVKRRSVLIIVAVVFTAVISAVLAFRKPATQPQAILPNPNGYHDFAAAAQWTVAWSGNLLALPPEGIRDMLKQNSMVLDEVHKGLKKQSVVPVTNDMNWFSSHMVQVGAHKSMAQLLVAEGLVHLNEERTNEAAHCFADCIVFAHAAHRNGLMIDELFAIACQAIGAQQLVQVAPHIAWDDRREILSELVALDKTREPASAIIRREREWSRGANGVGRSMWMRIVMFKDMRAAEVTFEKRQARSIAALRLVMTELAVRGYAKKNGKPPMALAELVPAWMPGRSARPIQQPTAHLPCHHKFFPAL